MKVNNTKSLKMISYSSFDEWKRDQSHSNQEIINSLQSLIKSIAPNFDTIVKWGQGCFINGQSPRIFLHTEPDYVQLGFYNGSELKDKYGLLEGNAKYVRHVKVYSFEDIDTLKFTELIKQVAD